MNPTTGYAETQPRLSRSGVFAGLALAALALRISAPTVQPFQRPDEIETMVSVVCWWAAMALVIWLAFSLAVWLVVLDRPELDAARWVRFITIPGSRKLAEGLLTVSVLAGVSACAPGAAEVAAPRIEVLRPADSIGVATSIVDTADLADAVAPGSTSTTLAAVGSLDEARSVVDTATLSVPTRSDARADPYSPGGNALAPSPEPAGPTTVDGPADRHVIVEGDNFWTIAADRVSLSLARPATAAEITPYWVTLVRANAESIHSGNPDLVFPGEVITLPAVSE